MLELEVSYLPTRNAESVEFLARLFRRSRDGLEWRYFPPQPMPNFLQTAARTAASCGVPDERDRASIACARSGIGYEPEPGALSGKTKVLAESPLRAEAESFMSV